LNGTVDSAALNSEANAFGPTLNVLPAGGTLVPTAPAYLGLRANTLPPHVRAGKCDPTVFSFGISPDPRELGPKQLAGCASGLKPTTEPAD
jgi:hypothetical protein